MSEDEDTVFVKRQKTIHYGSLEETMDTQNKLARMDADNLPAIQATSAHHIPEYFDINEEV